MDLFKSKESLVYTKHSRTARQDYIQRHHLKHTQTHTHSTEVMNMPINSKSAPQTCFTWLKLVCLRLCAYHNCTHMNGRKPEDSPSAIKTFAYYTQENLSGGHKTAYRSWSSSTMGSKYQTRFVRLAQQALLNPQARWDLIDQCFWDRISQWPGTCGASMQACLAMNPRECACLCLLRAGMSIVPHHTWIYLGRFWESKPKSSHLLAWFAFQRLYLLSP